MEGATSGRELSVRTRDVGEDVVDHPGPLVDARVDRLRRRLTRSDAAHVLQELLASRLRAAARLLRPLHVADSEGEQLPRQGLVALGVPLHALDALSQDPD